MSCACIYVKWPDFAGIVVISQIGCERRRGAQLPHLQSSTVLVDLARRQEALAGWRLVEEESHVLKEIGLIGLDREEVGSPGRADLAAEGLLTIERISADQPPAQQ